MEFLFLSVEQSDAISQHMIKVTHEISKNAKFPIDVPEGMNF